MSKPLPEEATDAYEALRFHVLHPNAGGAHGEGRALLMRQGMATWACQCIAVRTTPSPASPSPVVSATLAFPAELATELVGMMAELILRTRKEHPHGRTESDQRPS